MNSETFFRNFYKFRLIAIMAVLVMAAFWTIRSYCHVLDVEFRGPEWDRCEQETRDRQNEAARERVNEGSTNPKDIERSNEYERDHGV